MFSPMLDWYHIFMILVRFNFHKTICKRVQLSPFFFSQKFICRARESIYIKLVFNMTIFEILRSASSPLSILTNRILLINYYYLKISKKLKIIKNNLNFIIFLTNEKITNIVTNNFSTLNNILIIEVLHFNNFIPFKFTFKLFNSFSRSTSFSRNPTRLDGDLQPVLGSLGQFLSININFFKFSVYKSHLLRLVSILAKEKILSISI